MRKTLFRMMFVGILATAFTTSCSTTLPSIDNSATSNSLTGKWELDYIATNDGKSLAENFPMGAPYINFVSEKLVNASDGCNSINGPINVEGKTISFGNLISTMKACDGVNDYAFNSKLKGKLNYSISDNTLTLIKGDVAVMRFVRPTTLNGSWVLEEFIAKDRSAKTLDQRFPNKKPTVTFQNGQISGSNGCNNLTGAYVAIGKTIKMGNIATTRMACDGVDEFAFNDRFNAVDSYQIENGKLVLYASGVKTMVFGNLKQPR
ncbi:META domain-containing protein [Faecalibacter rhinopitheci]|uniref:META domain-containing protein n=1 Tax=Faecalibacter rhinopitheci TaxID=2779678 RepID=A0A8J7FSE3_9FLAO|nr:META domain-containing protein [Faecalibacter rhinopitheci]MBF0597928.1 META domain-containing protein [Faecalibacter rhinopitheci]